MEHSPAAHQAISGELVRLTLGGRPTVDDIWLEMTLNARLSMIARDLQAQLEQIGAALMPVMARIAQTLAPLTKSQEES